MAKFVKLSALTSPDRTKLKGYWKDLWGNEYADAAVEDYKPEGKTQKVKA